MKKVEKGDMVVINKKNYLFDEGSAVAFNYWSRCFEEKCFEDEKEKIGRMEISLCHTVGVAREDFPASQIRKALLEGGNEGNQ